MILILTSVFFDGFDSTTASYMFVSTEAQEFDFISSNNDNYNFKEDTLLVFQCMFAGAIIEEERTKRTL